MLPVATAEGLDPATGGPLAYLGTFLVATLFYGLTLLIAARYVLAITRVKRAFAIGAVLAVASIVLQRAGPAITAAVTVAIAYAAIRAAYDLSHRMTAFVTVIYYTVAVLVAVVVYNLVFLLGQAPG